jgi:hypothetical protein
MFSQEEEEEEAECDDGSAALERGLNNRPMARTYGKLDDRHQAEAREVKLERRTIHWTIGTRLRLER